MQLTNAIQVEPMGLVESQTRGEISSQVTTAKMYPRDELACIQKANQMACYDAETAAQMFYTLPARGQSGPIEGPSVRLAEVVAYNWGNFRVETNIEEIGDRYVTVVGSAFDVERNAAFRVRVKRRITTKSGARFSDDMIQVTCQAACSIAFREVVFKTIPRVYVDQIYFAARKASVGTQRTIEAKRADMISYFGKLGVSSDSVLKAAGVLKVEEITEEKLIALKGLATAIKENNLTIEEAFNTGGVTDEDIEDLASSLKGN